MTSSARTSTDWGMVKPRALAVFALITQLGFGGLLHWQIRGLDALQDFVNVDDALAARRSLSAGPAPQPVRGPLSGAAPAPPPCPSTPPPNASQGRGLWSPRSPTHQPLLAPAPESAGDRLGERPRVGKRSPAECREYMIC